MSADKQLLADITEVYGCEIRPFAAPDGYELMCVEHETRAPEHVCVGARIQVLQAAALLRRMERRGVEATGRALAEAMGVSYDS